MLSPSVIKLYKIIHKLISKFFSFLIIILFRWLRETQNYSVGKLLISFYVAVYFVNKKTLNIKYWEKIKVKNL